MTNIIQASSYFKWQFSLCLAMLLFALSMQHIFAILPCELCVYQRFVITLLLLISLIALIITNHWLLIGLTAIMIAGYLGAFLLARHQIDIENGTIVSACQIGQSNFPNQFALDLWLPWLFEAKALCSEILWSFFGLSMAELLSYLLLFLILWGLISLVYQFRYKKQKTGSENYKFDIKDE